MIIYISHDNCYTFKRFLKLWGQSLRGKIRFIYYADLAHRRTLPGEVSLFSDLERLSIAQLSLAIEAAQQLKSAGIPIINDPENVLRRYDLLQALRARGINEFTAYRLDETRATMSFPVFLRLEREHQGNLSPLLNNVAELESAIEKATTSGIAADNLLIVEFCDVKSNDGLYRKYAFFVAGGQFVPRHLLFNEQWMSKKPDVVNQNLVAEEMQLLQTHPHPHEAFFRDVFAMAGIGYGRADYSLLDGKIQVWEINTNPTLVPDAAVQRERQESWNFARDRVCAAMCQMIESDAVSMQPGSTPDTGKRVVFTASVTSRKALGVQSSDWWRHPLRRAARPLSSQRGQKFLRKIRLAK